MVLHLHTISVHEVFIGCLDMWVNDDDDTTALIFNLLVHLSDLGVCEVLRVELEVFISCRVTVLLSPLNITPQYIDREAIVSKLGVSIHEHVC